MHYHALQTVIKACCALEKLKRTLNLTLEAISGESAVIDAFAAKLEAHKHKAQSHPFQAETGRFSLLELE